MNNRAIRKILKDTDFIHTSGTAEELKVAEYLKDQCEAMGVKAWLESFPVAMATMEEAHLYAESVRERKRFLNGIGQMQLVALA